MTPPVNDLRELMLLYVTDGLDPSERESARRLIEANDPEALAALREAEELITRIPEALDPITPGAASTRRLMDRVFTKRVSGPAQAATSTRPHQSSRASNLALAASFVIGTLIGTFIAYSMLAPMNSEERVELEALRLVVDQQQLIIDRQQSQIDRSEITITLALMPGVESRELAGTPEQLAARGRLYWDDATGRISFIAQNLAQPAADSTYELWFITQAGQTVSLGTFTLDEIGSARYVTTLTQLPTDVSQAAVSLEPAGGSPQTSPTGPIVMASSTE